MHEQRDGQDQADVHESPPLSRLEYIVKPHAVRASVKNYKLLLEIVMGARDPIHEKSFLFSLFCFCQIEAPSGREHSRSNTILGKVGRVAAARNTDS